MIILRLLTILLMMQGFSSVELKKPASVVSETSDSNAQGDDGSGDTSSDDENGDASDDDSSVSTLIATEYEYSPEEYSLEDRETMNRNSIQEAEQDEIELLDQQFIQEKKIALGEPKFDIVDRGSTKSPVIFLSSGIKQPALTDRPIIASTDLQM